MNIVSGESWSKAPPGTSIGMLIIKGVANPASHPALEARKKALTDELRRRYKGFDRNTLRAQPSLSAYARFYKQFKKTYHLQLQLESILAGKPIPSVAALVEAMFMAELEDQLLTAGHDLDTVQSPVEINVSDGTQCFTRMNGRQQTLKDGDLYIADVEGVLSSVIYGPNRRTQIHAGTTGVLFTTYGVPGIGKAAIQTHLEKLRDYVRLISTDAMVRSLELIDA